MECNCSNPYCWSKIPEEAVVSRDPTKMVYKVRIQEKNWRENTTGGATKRSVVLTLDDWKILCENMRCTDDGTVWEAYVPDKK